MSKHFCTLTFHTYKSNQRFADLITSYGINVNSIHDVFSHELLEFRRKMSSTFIKYKLYSNNGEFLLKSIHKNSISLYRLQKNSKSAAG